MNDGFEVYWVTFQMPKFGSEGKEFDPHEWHMGVSTAGGRKDAEAACKKYHSGCKIIAVLTKLESDCGGELAIKKARAEESKKKSKKKGK